MKSLLGRRSELDILSRESALNDTTGKGVLLRQSITKDSHFGFAKAQAAVAAPRGPREKLPNRDEIPAGRRGNPVVLSQEKLVRFLAAVENPKHRMALIVCYAVVCGSPKRSASHLAGDTA